MIKAQSISYSYSEKPLFTEASFTVAEGTVAGLVGPNGAGKSTLLNLIAGKEQLDSGKIIVNGSLVLVPQEIKSDPVLDSATSIRSYIDPNTTIEDYQITTLLNGLEMGALSLYTPPKVLSGGQKTKLALARALLLEPDILLLDEPTNFLDVEGKKWVMKFLSSYPKTLVVISHDLKLLDNSIDKVIAINSATRKIIELNGNYTNYIKQIKIQDDLLRRAVITEQKHIKRMKTGLLKMDRFTSEKGIRQRTQLKKRIRKLEEALPDFPPEIRTIHFRLPEPDRVGELPVMIRNISKSYGDLDVLRDVSFSISRGERLALIGYNGAGKSTLLKIIIGLINQDAGVVIPDEKLSLGYYSQEFEQFNMESTILETAQVYSKAGDHIIRPLMAKFLFIGNKVFQKVGTLSGGEKTRLSIALLLLKNYNLLVLDEPTTYLDPLSQRIILEALKDYKGAMIVVSHTEEFIKELKPDRALLLPDEIVVQWSNELLEKVSEV